MKCSKQLYQMPVPSSEWSRDVLDVFIRCFVCNKFMFCGCGTPIVKMGGCCVGVKKGKKVYLASRYAHYGCFDPKKKYKLMKVIKNETKQ